MRIMLLAIIAGAITSPASAAGCGSRACAQRVAGRSCSQSRPVPCLRYAALRYRVNARLLVRISWCESRHDPLAHNASGASGVLQTLPSTFALSPFGRRWIFSARYGALAGAWLLRHQGTTPWLASRACWSR